ncbi:hypothetical protein SVIOM342S_01814 [Streptomyces violaceorubidus]
MGAGPAEAEPGVVLGVSEDDDVAFAETPGGGERGADGGRTGAAPLVLGPDGDGCQAQRGAVPDVAAGQQGVAGRAVGVVDRDEGQALDPGPGVGAQRVDEGGLFRRGEGGADDVADDGDVGAGLGAGVPGIPGKGDMTGWKSVSGVRSWEAGSGRRSGREGDPGVAKDGVEHGHQPHLPFLPLPWSTVERERRPLYPWEGGRRKASPRFHADRDQSAGRDQSTDRGMARWALAACLAAAAGLGGTAVWQYERAQDAGQRAAQAEQRAETLAGVLAAPDAESRTARLAGGASGTLVVSERRDRAVFLASGLAEPPRGKVYQLWFDDHGTMRSAGLMETGGTSRAVPAGRRRRCDGRGHHGRTGGRLEAADLRPDRAAGHAGDGRAAYSARPGRTLAARVASRCRRQAGSRGVPDGLQGRPHRPHDRSGPGRDRQGPGPVRGGRAGRCTPTGSFPEPVREPGC